MSKCIFVPWHLQLPNHQKQNFLEPVQGQVPCHLSPAKLHAEQSRQLLTSLLELHLCYW